MRRLPLRRNASLGPSQGSEASQKANSSSLPRTLVPSSGMVCSPRLMPVRLPAPIGPKLFVFGEPILHRYYTVFDWANKRIGFGLANSHQNSEDAPALLE